MLGLDTNVLLRIVDTSDAKQSAQVERLVRESGRGPFHLGHIVLSEFAMTLERRYQVPRGEIVAWLRHILEAPEFVVERAALVERAVDAFAASKADFADCLIGAANLASGCSTTVSFDIAALAVTDLFSPVPS